MSKVILPVGGEFPAFNDFTGNAGKFFGFDEVTREYEALDIPQPALDALLVNYSADVANINAAFLQAEAATTTGEEQQRYNDDRVDIAIVDALREELNVLRALHALPDIPQGQMDGKVRAKIATP